MLALLKILHYFAFSIGIGGGVANALMGIQAARAEPVARPHFGAVGQKIGIASVAGLVILWITGLPMVVWLYDVGSLSWAFWVKMLFVLALTGVAVQIQRIAFRARRAGTPPPAKQMKRLGMAALGASSGALIFAVIAFTG